MSLKNKKSLGQFYTTKYEYILKNMSIPFGTKVIIEPFAGNGDLLSFLGTPNDYKVECYDIDPKKDYIEERDTIANPPSYKNKFVLTNPPYLARNKSSDKILFDKYGMNDLYKCFLCELLENRCEGGIIIIPLNFLCSIRKNDVNLRKKFCGVYDILCVNIFEERVFDDTSYTVCCIQFHNRDYRRFILCECLCISSCDCLDDRIKFMVYPSDKMIRVHLGDYNNYMLGGEIYKLSYGKDYEIKRLTKNNIDEQNTNILVKCIDDNADSMCGLKFVPDTDIFIDNTPNLSARSYATLIITPILTSIEQKKLVDDFNNFLGKKRKEYNSLFLTNYRESKDISRKRISFDLVYRILHYLLELRSSL